jgi:hypothetical protein
VYVERKIMLSNHSYCAGLFDAEGTIGYYERKGWEKFKPELAIQMAHKPTVEYFCKITECGTVRACYRKDKEGKKLMFRWRISGVDDILRIAKWLRPLLIVKQEELNLLVEALQTNSFEKQQTISFALRFLKHTSHAQELTISDNTEDIDNSYLAGFFDGDGSFEPSHLVRKSVRASALNCDPDPLLRMAKKFGGTVRLNTKETEKKRASWKWTVCGKIKVKNLLDAIQSQLIEKADAAMQGRKACETEAQSGPEEFVPEHIRKRKLEAKQRIEEQQQKERNKIESERLTDAIIRRIEKKRAERLKRKAEEKRKTDLEQLERKRAERFAAREEEHKQRDPDKVYPLGAIYAWDVLGITEDEYYTQQINKMQAIAATTKSGEGDP